MCLYLTDKSKFKKSRKAKIVFKVVRHNPNSNDICSCYYSFTYKLNTLYENKARLYIEEYDNMNVVNAGFHSFIDYDGVKDDVDYFKSLGYIIDDSNPLDKHAIKIKVAICEIPKGSTYIEGLFTDGGISLKTIVSDKIIIKEIMSFNEFTKKYKNDKII